jgi:diguanylate cyclase (GGDEF)-like protein
MKTKLTDVFRGVNFRQQLSLTFSVGIILLALTSTYVITLFSSNTVKERIVDEGLSLTEGFAEQSTLALLYQSKDNAEEAVKAIMSFPDVLGVEIINADASTLYSIETEAALGSTVTEWPAAVQLRLETDNHWEFMSPVYTSAEEELSPFEASVAERELLGYVRLFVGKATLKHMQADIFQYNLIISISFASVLLLVLLAITNRVTNPIKNLANTMLLARAGRSHVRAELKGTRDIMEMEAAFNAMMNVLEAREAALKTARDQALESARIKGEFAANVSHELRTPMNGVLGMLELLEDMGLNTKQIEYLQVAKGSAESLLSLIDDILDFSKNDAGKTSLELKDFDLRALLDELVVLMAKQAHHKNLDLAYILDPQAPINLVGDAERLRQVLLNLIGNALKFTDSGDVGIEVELLETRGDKAILHFAVTDTGIGIAPDAQQKIFDAFSQADGSTTRKYGGTGLGLAICRQLISLMGGELHLNSEPGRGSTFSFDLPVLCQAVQQAKSQHKKVRAGLRVLVIDDSAVTRRSMAILLDEQSIGYQMVADAEEAQREIALAAENKSYFDIAFVDEKLPGISGEELLRQMKNMPGYQPLHTVLLVNRSVVDAEQQRDMPVSAQLAKPLMREQLQTCIDSLLKRTRPRAPAPGTSKAKEQDRLFRGSRILVVEDNTANQQVALGMLERLGCTVAIAANGRDCLALVARQHFDLVLMDCHMPEMDGYEATQQIREWEEGEHRLPIVAMTANVQKGDAERCLAAGMDDYLAKPLSVSGLREKLELWLLDDYRSMLDDLEPPLPETEPVDIPVESTTDPVDCKILQELRDQIGDEIFLQMLEAFLDDMPDYLRSLEEAVDKGDAGEIADVAHTIKGAVSNFGAAKLVGYCQRMEEMGRKESIDKAPELLVEIRAEIWAVQRYLNDNYMEDVEQAEAEKEENAERQELDISSYQPLILVVEDDRGARYGLCEVLRNEGYRIEEAQNGEEALLVFEAKQPDLVLMDAVMPKMDGFTACAMMQTAGEGKKVPVLIITALNDEDSIARAFASGAVDYISKPVNFSVLRKRISRLLEARHAERHAQQLAYNDALTGLPNRVKFNEKLADLLHAPRRENSKLALLFLDLDRFKMVNDTLGHEAGDLLLKYFAERVQGCLRKNDIVARFGGDEFTIVLNDIFSYDVVSNIAEKIQQTLSRPFMFMSKEMYVSTSIGIAVFPDHGKDLGNLLKNADMAMYRAKEKGSSYEFYDTQMETDVAKRVELEHDLRSAVEREQLVLHYQPQEDLLTGDIIGMEALVRWEHPVRGLVPPDEFIGLAEETGQIIEIGDWVLREACQTVQQWRKCGYRSIRVAVNLSARQLMSPGMTERLAAVLAETGLPAEQLELEITESAIMEHPEAVIVTLERLKDMGLMLAIDDFGTGYSSLNYLKRFPIDVIKIDRSFVSDVTSNQVDADIVTTIIGLAKVMKVKVVAEGVETELQKAFLKNQQCDFMQGYFLSKPVPAEEFEERFLEYNAINADTGKSA